MAVGSKKKRHSPDRNKWPAETGRFAVSFEGREEKSFAEQMHLWRLDLSTAEILAHKGLAPRRAADNQVRRVSPLATLDLHGRTSSDLSVLIDGFLLTQTRLGVDQVRIITGKGLHSPGPPVLRDTLDQMLRAMRFAGRIESFRWEAGSMADSGAVLVRLRLSPSLRFR